MKDDVKAHLYQEAVFRFFHHLNHETSSGADSADAALDDAIQMANKLFKDGTGYQPGKRTHGSGTGQD